LKVFAAKDSHAPTGAAVLRLLLTTMLFALQSQTANALPPTTPPAEVPAAINGFGLRLLRTLTDGTGANTIVSPLSVSLALAMAYNGASGTTKSVMAKTLRIDAIADADFNHNERALLDRVQKADPAIQIEIANALWPQSGFRIEPDFIRLSHDFFDAAPESLNFAEDPEEAASRINSWVKEKTHGKIPEIVKEPPRSTVLVLTDAVYFKGRWTVPFSKKETKPRSFHLPGGRSITAPMMIQRGRYSYLETESFQAIRLPYGNDRFAMYVFLPRTTSGLPDFLRSLDEQHWNQWLSKLLARQGQIVLPRFESSYGQKLNDALTAMGMGVVFGPSADFSRIHPPPPSLHINDVEHKTYVKLDEEGTEAAAATSVGMVAQFAGGPQRFEMIVDHPFFCTIVEQQSGAMLFAGVVTDPTR
jgi:serine protease inhibitor